MSKYPPIRAALTALLAVGLTAPPATAGPLFVGMKSIGVDDGTIAGPLISADGSTLVGQTFVYRDPSLSHNDRQQGYRYQWTGGIETIGALGSPDLLPGNSYARAVSADGRVNVGNDVTGQAFRWREGAGMSALPALTPNTFY